MNRFIKKIKINKISKLFIVVVVVFTYSCDNFLERDPLSEYTSSGDFFSTEGGLKLVTTGVYRYCRYQDNDFAYLLPLQHSFDLWTAYNVERAVNNSIGAGGAMRPNIGSITWVYIFMYRAIARIHTILDGAEPYYDGLTLRGKQYVAEMKVLRAHAYFILTATYGDVPYLQFTVTPDVYQKKQDPKKEIIDDMLEDLAEAAEILDWQADQEGRVTKAFALGLRARIALHFGTMALNDADEMAVWEDPDHYLEIARDAAPEIIVSGLFGLNPKFTDLFTVDGQKANVNNELIHQNWYTNEIASPTWHNIGFGQHTRFIGQSGRFPTQMLVDTYETSNGLRIDQDPAYDPKEPFTNRDPRLKMSIAATGDTMIGNIGGVKVKAIIDAYKARSRFWSEVNPIVDGDRWQDADNPDVIGAVATYAFVENGCGYIYRKYTNDDSEPIQVQTCNVIVMRFAEILLTYAEAKIELGEIDQSVHDALNRLRARAYGVDVSATTRYPAITTSDQWLLRQRVRREWKVELFQEGHHLFNMRRWRTGELENHQPSFGHPHPRTWQLAKWMEDNPGRPASAMPESAYVNGYSLCDDNMVPDFKKDGERGEYDLNDIPDYSAYASKLRTRDNERFWLKKFYLFPKPQGELDKNLLLEQNPLWLGD